MRILLEHHKTVQKSGNFGYSKFFCFCCLNFICHKINVVWCIYDYYTNQMSSQWWWHDCVILWRHKCAKLHHFQNHQVFAIINAIFNFYYTFSCVISLIYWFFNRFFYETLVDQNLGKPKFFQNFVIWTYIQASDFCCFRVSYWTPMFIINCKCLFASDDCTITA